MSRAKGFCDLNIPATNERLKETVLKAISLGYQTVAIDQRVTLPSLEKGGSKKRKRDEDGGSDPIVPPPVIVNLTPADLQQYKITREPVILTRITISYSDPSSPYLLKSADAMRQYDLIAFIPENDATLKQVMTGKIDVDIISLMPDSSVYQLSKSLLKSAVDRDIYFEITYSPCLTDPYTRKQIILLAFYLHRTCKSSNIIITSQARSPEQLRYPYDVMNVGRFLGLSEFAAKAAIGSMAYNTVYCASARRKGVSKCAVQITVNPVSEDSKYNGLDNAEEYMNMTRRANKKKKGTKKNENKIKKKKKKAKTQDMEIKNSDFIKF